MLSEEKMRDLAMRNRAFHFDRADESLDELIDEFLAVGNAQTASILAGMRMSLYSCGEQLGIDENNRGVKFEKMRDKSIAQQAEAVKLIGGK